MSRIAYVNGRYLPHRHASVHVEDRGYQFADGVYEVVCVVDGRLADAELHLRRLWRSLRELRIPAPVPEKSLLAIVAHLCALNRIATGLVYIQVTRGVARREHAFPKPGTRPSLIVTLRRIPPVPESLADWGGVAITAADERWARCDIKSVALLPNVLAKQAAREAGAVEAILIDRDGMVTEGSSTTVWIVDAAGVLRTRPLSHAILPGCTRAALAEEMARGGVTLLETPFSLEDLRAAREVFLTSATSFVKPMLAVDGEPVGDGRLGPVAQRLFALLRHRITEGRNAAP